MGQKTMRFAFAAGLEFFGMAMVARESPQLPVAIEVQAAVPDISAEAARWRHLWCCLKLGSEVS